MIELLFQWLLIPAFLPGMADQSLDVQTRLEAVHQHLIAIDKELAQFAQDPVSLVSVSMKPLNPLAEGERLTLPRVTGRVLGEGWSPEVQPALAPLAKDPAAVGSDVALRGVLKVGNSRVAILSRGEEEYVLSTGSYWIDKYRVREIGPTHVQLQALQGKGADLRLTLSQASGESGMPKQSSGR